MDTFGEYEFAVRSYECGKDGYASLATICNYLQEAASLNAETLKFSKSDFEAAKHVASNGKTYATSRAWKFNSLIHEYKVAHPFT